MTFKGRIEIRLDEETEKALERKVKKTTLKRATVARLALRKGLGLKNGALK